MVDFADFADKLTILDGAWGTELAKLGLPPGDSCERWNLQAPDNVVRVGRAYVEAGSQIIITNSFQGNLIALAQHGLADSVFEINRTAVELSRRAADDRAMVFASIGPSGKMLLTGDVTHDQLLDAFSQQVRGLSAAKPDAIVLESFADLDEWKIAAQAVRDNSDLPIVASLTFDSGPDNTRTMMGVSPTDAIAAADEMKLSAVGANCGVGVEAYLEVARQLRHATDLPIWIKPNAGLPVQLNGKTTFTQPPIEFAQHARKIIDLGVNFIGGCCGTTPEHIAELVKINKQ